MFLNTLRPGEGSKHAPKRVGRGIGSGLGKTGGRGHKGLKSRSQMPLQRRLPKFGFTSRQAKYVAEVRLNELAAVNAEVVDLAALKGADIIGHQIKTARVILSGSIDKAITIRGLKVTKGARAAIEAAGGKVEE